MGNNDSSTFGKDKTSIKSLDKEDKHTGPSTTRSTNTLGRNNSQNLYRTTSNINNPHSFLGSTPDNETKGNAKYVDTEDSSPGGGYQKLKKKA
jgi:hypothetical protein